MTTGRFITFEGGEGAGKSTQALALQVALAAVGIKAILTREPGGTAFAEAIRTFLLHGGGRQAPGTALAEAMLFFAARADHVERVIRPALASGVWVICDRFTDSTRAYQGAASGVADDLIVALDRLVVNNTQPALTLLLDLPVAAGMARADARRAASAEGTASGKDTFEARDLAFHERLRHGFMAIARAEPHRCVVVDAAAQADVVTRAVLDAVQRRLGVALGAV